MRPKTKKLDEQFFAKFNSPLYYKKEEIILRPGENPSGIYYIKKGYVRLYSVSKSGQEITFNIYRPKTYLFMMRAITNTPNNYFFETITEVEILKAPVEESIEFIKSEPDLLYALTKRIFSGLEGMIDVIQALLGGNARSKIATVILMLTKRFGIKRKNGDVMIQIPLTHRLLASLAGLTRETTSLELAILQGKKIIQIENHKCTVKKFAKLEFESNISLD